MPRSGASRRLAQSPVQAVDPVETASRLRLSVTRLARLLRQGDPDSLPPTLAAALATVEREGPLTLGELAAREHVAPPSITKAVDRLAAEGLVERVPDAFDRRVCRVQVSPEGRRRVAQGRSRRDAWLATRLQELPPEAVARLAAATEVLESLIAVEASVEASKRESAP